MAASAGQSEVIFPIVGVGASAGGLEAFEGLLKHLPHEAGIAVVLVADFDPKVDGTYADRLARATRKGIVTATNGTRIHPGRVYVIPSNVDVTVEEATLRLKPRVGRLGGGRIDRFFRSLAEDRAAQAVGLVLSGKGSDGVLGLRAIQAQGGITFAQDATAAQDQMPRSAIVAGCVDFTLAPDEMAHAIAAIARLDRRTVRTPSARWHDGSDLSRVLEAVRRSTGVDLAHHTRAKVWRRAHRRMLLNRLDDLVEYARLLESNPAEAEALAEEMFVHLTTFFRDPGFFEALKVHAFPPLLARERAAEPVRVWIPGCSTGEEAYSIGIALLEFLADAGSNRPLRVFGTDVSDVAIVTARAGRYIENVALDLSPRRLDRHFVKTGDGYQVRQNLRASFVFAKHDVTRQPPLPKMDLISCRNLQLTMGPELQDDLLSAFHFALSDGGCLLLGASDVGRAHPGFEPAGRENAILRRVPIAEDTETAAHAELPAAYQELEAVNEEMLERSREAMQLNEDLSNVMTVMSLPLVLLGPDCTIRRFSPPAGELFNLVGADVGHPFGNSQSTLEVADVGHRRRSSGSRDARRAQREGRVGPLVRHDGAAVFDARWARRRRHGRPHGHRRTQEGRAGDRLGARFRRAHRRYRTRGAAGARPDLPRPVGQSLLLPDVQAVAGGGRRPTARRAGRR
jgi:two-component system CheB/CheR fusion protein